MAGFRFRQELQKSASNANMDKVDSMTCPVCGKRAQIRFFDSTKALWVYKHPGIRVKRNQTPTIYHEDVR